MDIATFSGIIVFAGFVVASVYMGEGWAGFKPFMNAEAFLVVLGGTACAILVNYPMSALIGVGKVLKQVLTSKGRTPPNWSPLSSPCPRKPKRRFWRLKATLKP